MPYSNITFVKIKMELFEDDRFLIDLNDTQKGLYLMLLGLAGKTDNKIRNDAEFIKKRLNLDRLNMADLAKISEIFPKFSLKNGYWKFKKFEEIHNYTIGKKGKSKGIPSELQRIVQKENEKEKEKKKENENLNRPTASPFKPKKQEPKKCPACEKFFPSDSYMGHYVACKEAYDKAHTFPQVAA